ncbi:MAG TPA: energy transducer TonB [Blastocatellia bacterium]|nr:energy transducer TonB [Blastocatellia bacterium]
MFRVLVLNAVLLVLSVVSLSEASSQRSQPAATRVALIDFIQGKADSGASLLDSGLREALSRDDRLVVIDRSMMQAALTGVGYAGSLNMTRDEARRVGSAIGCDFFIVGKTEALTRSERERESHEDAYAAVLIVDGRTGALAAFDFISEKAVTRESAINAVSKILASRAASYVDRMLAHRDSSQAPPRTLNEPIEDIPEEGSPRADGFTPPEILNRVRPEYSPQAERADITATVEALAVLRASGEVGDVEITRWGGFGLDESAEHAIRQLKFKPATRDGKAINVRALIRYNFRRLTEPGSPREGSLRVPALAGSGEF